MSKESDENRDEDLENEDQDAAEAEDTDSDSDAEDQEESEEDSEDESDEDESEDKSDDEDDEEGDDDEEEEDMGKKGKFVMPDKFKGKSAEEIAEAYKNLEGMIGEKALEMAQNFLTKKGIKAKPEDGKKEDDDEEFDIGLTDEEIAKMSPKEFARHLNRKITEKATDIAKNAIERSNEVKTNVSREIKEATKAHPHLKENKEYREIVLSIIEAANAKGKVVTLKEACEKADKAMNIKPSEKKDDDKGDQGGKKKKRPAVEKQDGGDSKPPKTDEDRVKEGMLNAGSSTFLGGLGV